MSRTPTASGEKAKRVELIIAQLDSLPTLPAVAARLLQVTTGQSQPRRRRPDGRLE